MDIFLALSTLLMFLFGFFVMKRIDVFIEASQHPKGIKEPEKTEKTEKDTVLILGDSLLADKLKKLLTRYEIEYEQIVDSNDYDSQMQFQYLFAVSDNDFENIMICIMAGKDRNICKMRAVCNNMDNRTIFEQNHIPCLFGTNISEETFYQTTHEKSADS